MCCARCYDDTWLMTATCRCMTTVRWFYYIFQKCFELCFYDLYRRIVTYWLLVISSKLCALFQAILFLQQRMRLQHPTSRVLLALFVATWKHISLADLSITDCRGQSATAIRQFIFDWHMLRHQLLNGNNKNITLICADMIIILTIYFKRAR